MIIVNGFSLSHRQYEAGCRARDAGGSVSDIANALVQYGVPETRGSVNLPWTAATRIANEGARKKAG